ncbi:MAG: ERCC4 domain-containing protein, partial [Candidatus Odinarchaeia archaeon]
FRLVHILELLETQGLITVKKYFDKLEKESVRSGSPRAIKNILSNPKIIKIRKEISELIEKGVIHPKLDYTIKLLQERFSSNPNSRVIVFSQYRDSALFLTNKLNELSNIKAKRFVGQATREGDKGITQKEQLEILNDFKKGLINVLVATSVAEEGLDIHECDLVLFYDISPSVVRFIQRKGRTGRKYPGSVIILITKNTRDEAYYWSVYRKERKIQYIVNSMKLQKTIKSISASQNRLDKFINESNNKEEKIKIIVDSREIQSPVVRELSNLNVKVESAQLNEGDYLISESTIVERKTDNDFIQSIIDKRLFNQLIKLKNNYETPILIIEGENLYSIRNIHPNAVRGALASIVLDYNIPILWSYSPEDTAKLLYFLASREQLVKKKSISLKKTKLKPSVSEMQLRLLSNLPQVNFALSRRLLEKFRKPINVFNASEEELKTVEGVGDVKAKKIKEVLETEFTD